MTLTRPQDIYECVYKLTCKNCNKTYIGETGRAFGVRLQEHRQEVSQRDVRAYTRSTSRSLAGEQNKSAVTDHAISLNHVLQLGLRISKQVLKLSPKGLASKIN